MEPSWETRWAISKAMDTGSLLKTSIKPELGFLWITALTGPFW